MRIWHRGKLEAEHGEFLKEQGVRIKPLFRDANSDKPSHYEFIVAEDEVAWPEVKRRVVGTHTFIRTEFTKDEIAQAEWSIAWATSSIGDLRPGDYGWSTEFFADQCTNCGGGWRQIAPFCIKKEPKLGNNAFADFGSAFELFCTPIVLETFKTRNIGGFDTRPIILHKEDRPAKGLRQLIVTELADPAIAEELVEHERYTQTDCPVCGRTWHSHYTRGTLPLRKRSLNPKADLLLTNEWFGNGRTARHEILFSNRVVRLILEHNWEGIELTPVRVV